MWYEHCTLCPRRCGVDRRTGQGACKTAVQVAENGECRIPVARAALHFWEEPCIAGTRGSGAVFFSGCSLGCAFCQNREISTGQAGLFVSQERLKDIFLELQAQGAHNINLVTAGHVLPVVREALTAAKAVGLSIPIVYNTSSYETVESLRTLEGLVDIYLPDAKYVSEALAGRFSGAADYPAVAWAALQEMVRQTGPYRMGADGLLERGVVIRHLVLPGCTMDSKAVLKKAYDLFGDTVLYSVLNQYTPTAAVQAEPLLKRHVRPSEYARVLNYACDLGITGGYRQEAESASESFIPPFDYTGVEKPAFFS